MRISTIEGSPDFRHNTADIHIMLDGKLSPHTIAADEETGEVVRYRINRAGKFMVVGNEFKIETVRGVVKIVLPPNWVDL